MRDAGQPSEVPFSRRPGAPSSEGPGYGCATCWPRSAGPARSGNAHLVATWQRTQLGVRMWPVCGEVVAALLGSCAPKFCPEFSRMWQALRSTDGRIKRENNDGGKDNHFIRAAEFGEALVKIL